MNTEEKARAYDEALERAKKIYDASDSDVNHTIITHIFPELRESEDERISKEIIGYLESKVSTAEETELLYFKRWIAWLEEQKDKNCLACDQHLKGYLAGRKVTEEEKQKEQKPVEWSEEDEKNIYFLTRLIELYIKDGRYETGDGTVTKPEIIKMLKSLRPSWKPTEEQIGALNYAYCELFKREDIEHNILGPLQRLCDDLMKL